ncbi:hypothetical protein KY084_15175 [Stakelama sp. CBK3Z-3]|uniref:Uncharacterized protein n=1 Tax=Stakelama flava TaxID=2860338 RepID=A0ABS6XQY2_9SPHN|nr:hypothetical protein [Stakelama flava]MBW4332203.1 hypothetical protein [Stakelama flava]
MADVDGTWETVTKTPMGDQKAEMTINSSGDSFTGTFAGDMGQTEIEDGKVNGNTVTFKISIKSPMPMTLDGEATVDGDTMNGNVKAGAFGAFPLTGTRKA